MNNPSDEVLFHAVLLAIGPYPTYDVQGIVHEIFQQREQWRKKFLELTGEPFAGPVTMQWGKWWRAQREPHEQDQL